MRHQKQSRFPSVSKTNMQPPLKIFQEYALGKAMIKILLSSSHRTIIVMFLFKIYLFI